MKHCKATLHNGGFVEHQITFIWPSLELFQQTKINGKRQNFYHSLSNNSSHYHLLSYMIFCIGTFRLLEYWWFGLGLVYGVLWHLQQYFRYIRLSWQPVLLVKEMKIPGENHRPVASHWKTLLHNVVSGTPCHEQGSNSQLISDRHWLHR